MVAVKTILIFAVFLYIPVADIIIPTSKPNGFLKALKAGYFSWIS